MLDDEDEIFDVTFGVSKRDQDYLYPYAEMVNAQDLGALFIESINHWLEMHELEALLPNEYRARENKNISATKMGQPLASRIECSFYGRAVDTVRGITVDEDGAIMETSEWTRDILDIFVDYVGSRPQGQTIRNYYGSLVC